MNTSPTVFSFAPGMNLRTITKDGQPWFVAADICEALNLSNTTVALSKVEHDDRAKLNLGLRGLGAVNVVNESGLYDLIFQSRKPEALAFKKWVTSVVLPAIRKDGAYVKGEEKVAHGHTPSLPSSLPVGWTFA